MLLVIVLLLDCVSTVVCVCDVRSFLQNISNFEIIPVLVNELEFSDSTPLSYLYLLLYFQPQGMRLQADFGRRLIVKPAEENEIEPHIFL